MMRTRWQIGDDVRVTRNVRNDGTFPGADIGDMLVRRGTVGTVIELGTFLGDQIIYSVHFIELDRIVGCREEELIDGDQAWIPNAYDVRERVAARKILKLGADLCVPTGAIGEVLRVLRESDQIGYHIHFDCLPGRTLAVPENALSSLAEAHRV